MISARGGGGNVDPSEPVKYVKFTGGDSGEGSVKVSDDGAMMFSTGG